MLKQKHLWARPSSWETDKVNHYKELLNKAEAESKLRVQTSIRQTAEDIIKLVDIKTAITGGGNDYHIVVPILKEAIRAKYLK